MPEGIKLIIGLGNPGPDYIYTRHNAGVWFLRELAAKEQADFKLETKLKAEVCKLSNGCRLVIPTTYMNDSGQAVLAVAHYFKTPPEQILVAHDELDFPAGSVKIKKAGGHGGHNGLRDIIKRIGADFWRLRIGIGHPGDKNKVHSYVLNKPNKQDEALIMQSIDRALGEIDLLWAGHFEKAMTALH